MLQQTFSSSFEVQQIIDQKEIQGQTHFLVKWVGYDHEQNTWEPERHMTHSKEKVKEWEKYKIKQLEFLENGKGLESIQLGPSIFNTQNIIKKSKTSTPYKLLTSPMNFQDNPHVPKTFFDTLPKFKRSKKLQKIQRKKKQLQLFQKRMKSKPKVWEQYLVNQQEAVRKANQKIKQIVDRVYGTDKYQKEKQKIIQQKNELNIIDKQSLRKPLKLIKQENQPQDKKIIKENNRKEDTHKIKFNKKSFLSDSSSEEQSQQISIPKKKLKKEQKSIQIQQEKKNLIKDLAKQLFIKNKNEKQINIHKNSNDSESILDQSTNFQRKSKLQKPLFQFQQNKFIFQTIKLDQKIQKSVGKQNKQQTLDLKGLKRINKMKVPQINIQIQTIKLTKDLFLKKQEGDFNKIDILKENQIKQNQTNLQDKLQKNKQKIKQFQELFQCSISTIQQNLNMKIKKQIQINFNFQNENKSYQNINIKNSQQKNYSKNDKQQQLNYYSQQQKQHKQSNVNSKFTVSFQKLINQLQMQSLLQQQQSQQQGQQQQQKEERLTDNKKEGQKKIIMQQDQQNYSNQLILINDIQ